VAVLGLGSSSIVFSEIYNQRGYEAVILCNFEDRDLQHSPFRRAISEIPQVILLANISEPAPSCRTASEIGVTSVVEIRRSGDFARQRSIWRLNKLGKRVLPLPDHYPDSLQKTTRGTGLVGVALASMIADEVDVFGIEFYRSDYIRGDYSTVAAEAGDPDLREIAGEIECAFENLIKLHADKQFTMYCHAEHSLSEPNLDILRF